MSFNFKDKKGREWDCTIDVPTIERLISKDSAGVNLYGALDNEMSLYKSIMTDARQLMGVVWGIIKPQADMLQPPLTQAEWFKAINGDVIEAMGEAFTLALADFSPALKKGLLLKGWEKGQAVEKAAAKKGHAALDKIDVDKIAKHRVALLEEKILDLTKTPSAAASGGTSVSLVSPPGPDAR